MSVCEGLIQCDCPAENKILTKHLFSAYTPYISSFHQVSHLLKGGTFMKRWNERRIATDDNRVIIHEDFNGIANPIVAIFGGAVIIIVLVFNLMS